MTASAVAKPAQTSPCDVPRAELSPPSIAIGHDESGRGHAHDHSHDHHHGHGHAHNQRGHHHADPHAYGEDGQAGHLVRARPDQPAFSLLRLSAVQRLSGVGILVVILWGLVAWAIQ